MRIIHWILGTTPPPEPSQEEGRRECISHGTDCDQGGND